MTREFVNKKITHHFEGNSHGTQIQNRWFVNLKPNPHAVLRLFCFHYAGGTASVFRPWAAHLPDGIELLAIQLPGRESRFGEDPFTDLSLAVDAAATAIQPLLTKPYIFFGHSLGAKFAYHLALLCQLRYWRTPAHLIVSGDSAPQLLEENPIQDLPDAEFIKALQKYNGLPKELSEVQELLDLLMPTIRADVKLSETTLSKESDPLLNCPITAFAGTDDNNMQQSDLYAWGAKTAKSFKCKHFLGDHFFINSAKKDVLTALNQIITGELSSAMG